MSVKTFLKTRKADAGRLLPVAVALGLASGVLLILQAWIVARVVDGVLFGGRTLADEAPRLAGLFGLFALRAGLGWASEHTAFAVAARVKGALRRDLHDRLLALGPVRLAGDGAGDLATMVTEGVEAMEGYFARFLPALSLMVLVPFAILVVVAPLDWLSGLVMVLTAPLIPLFMVLIGRGAERLNQRQWADLARMSGRFLDALQGLTLLKMFDASRREAEVVSRLSEDYRRATMSVLRIAFLSSLALEFFATVSIAVVAVLIGFRLLWGDLDFFSGFYVLLLAPEFYLPLRLMGSHYHARMDAIGAADRMVDVLERTLPARPAEAAAALPEGPPSLRFEDVRVTFDGGRRALDGLDIEVRPGERVALVGASGAGKSTVFNLLLGFVAADGGKVTVGGIPLDHLDPDAWRARLAWVPQSPHMFHGTILDNIRLGRPTAGFDEVRTAARLAQAEQFILTLPDGYDTPLGERGEGLSGGQIQRLALARAFLRPASLVLLDEATAGLDPRTETALAAAFDELAQGRTVLSVAHRLQTVRRADRILVLDRGRLVESGTHDELLAANGPYRHLVEARHAAL